MLRVSAVPVPGRARVLGSSAVPVASPHAPRRAPRPHGRRDQVFVCSRWPWVRLAVLAERRLDPGSGYVAL